MSGINDGTTEIINHQFYGNVEDSNITIKDEKIFFDTEKESVNDATTSDSSKINQKTMSDESSSKDHTNIVANHYNALEEKGLVVRDQSRIITMRNFNNWIKSMLIDEYVMKIKENKSYGDPVRVLDLGCGKGGDLLKWNRGKINYLICADIAEVSVEQCRERYNTMGTRREPVSFKAEFHAYDCTKVRLREKFKDASMQLDLVSCQFAFHYCFESLPQAECMFRNASESLKPGGYFIGTIPNAYEIVSRWKKAEGNKFGNEIYSIEFECCKNKPPLFGAKYNFHLEGVVDCPEFLVYLPMFRKLALKYGLEMIYFESFEEFFAKSLHNPRIGKMNYRARDLLFKMKALNTYRPGESFANNTEEYQHAKDYLNNNPDAKLIGTLSKSEWEAITLYSVFAFQKMKTVWNAEGKPEYVKC